MRSLHLCQSTDNKKAPLLSDEVYDIIQNADFLNSSISISRLWYDYFGFKTEQSIYKLNGQVWVTTALAMRVAVGTSGRYGCSN